jgi:hypothetical protein
MTRSEQFVHDLTKDACLRLWTYPSPQGKGPGKELCDTLVACPPDVIVISVKEIELKRGAEKPRVALDRWKRKAVDASVKQVYGAVRRLSNVSTVTAMDGSAGVDLGSQESRRFHRIAVAIGGEGLVPLQSRDYGQGFVHVFDADTFHVVLSELDTITDLVEYLAAREELLTRGMRGNVITSEHDLLAVYFMNTHSFAPLLEVAGDLVFIGGIWDNFVARPEYAERVEANRISRLWDSMINTLHEDQRSGSMEYGGDLHSVDRVTRVMARESRTERRGLSQAFMEFLNSPVPSRMVMGSSGTTYVFLKKPHAEDREYRKAELAARVRVARDTAHSEGRDGPVVGIATETFEPDSGLSLDAMLFDQPVWREREMKEAQKLRIELALFANPVRLHRNMKEFPST